MILEVVCEPLWQSKKTQRPVFCLLLFYSQYFLSGSVFGTEAALVQEDHQASSCWGPSLVCQVRNMLETWTRPGEKNDLVGGVRKDYTSHALVYGKKLTGHCLSLCFLFWAIFGIVHVIGEKKNKEPRRNWGKMYPPSVPHKVSWGEKDYNWLILHFCLFLEFVPSQRLVIRPLLNSSKCLPLSCQPLDSLNLGTSQCFSLSCLPFPKMILQSPLHIQKAWCLLNNSPFLLVTER